MTSVWGLLGICGGGGYSLAAAQTDKRFKSLATVSMFNSGRVRRNGYNDSQMDSIQQRLQQASAARAQEAAGGAVLYSGDANLTDEQIAKLPFELYRQGYEYYWKTHAHPNSTFKYTTSSLLDLMRFDATDHIELINQPLLMIAGSKADSLYMTQDAFPKATGTTDKEVFILDGATHRNLLGAALCRCRDWQTERVLRTHLVMSALEGRASMRNLLSWNNPASLMRGPHQCPAPTSTTCKPSWSSPAKAVSPAQPHSWASRSRR
jgi:hypothetical protein